MREQLANAVRRALSKRCRAVSRVHGRPKMLVCVRAIVSTFGGGLPSRRRRAAGPKSAAAVSGAADDDGSFRGGRQM